MGNNLFKVGALAELAASGLALVPKRRIMEHRKKFKMQEFQNTNSPAGTQT